MTTATQDTVAMLTCKLPAARAGQYEVAHMRKTKGSPRVKRLQVLSSPCDECLFSTAAIVSDSRREEILKTCASSGRYFVCHKSSIQGGKAACHGFYHKIGNAFTRLATLCGMVDFIPVQSLLKLKKRP